MNNPYCGSEASLSKFDTLFRLDLEVIESTETQSRFGLFLHNLSTQKIENWQLSFSVTRFVIPNSVSKGQLDQVGSLCVYQTEQPLMPGAALYFEYSHNTKPFTFFDEGISSASLRIGSTDDALFYPVKITPIKLVSANKPKCALAEKTLINQKEITQKTNALSLIPMPNKLIQNQGSFVFDSNTRLYCDSLCGDLAANWLASELKQHLRQDISIKSSSSLENTPNQRANIHFIKTNSLPENHYRLSVTPQIIFLYAKNQAGFIHASATLLQLLPSKPSHKYQFAYAISCVDIEDSPRYDYRGMLLDCARHFHPVSRIKGLINQLARYKFNYFHWHLTDDEGWRIEIDAYPALTQIGAWRGPSEVLAPQYSSLHETYGGFYSKKDIKEIIDYAAARAITIIPEFDLPGHCRAAIKSLPDLLVEKEDKSQYLSIQHYTDNVLNPGLPTTYEFIETVLGEICALFPGPYIHIGADEVPSKVWSKSPACKRLKEQEGYQDDKALQGHLLRHIEKFLHTKGKQMMGWEEAMLGDKVSQNTTLFTWINQDSAFDCLNKGYPIVMQPAQFTYLDMAQSEQPDEAGTDWAGKLPLEKVYQFEPFSGEAISPQEKAKIKGIQCALWCELTHNQSRFEYMIYPRLLAIAEVCWSAKSKRNWIDFKTRLKGQQLYLDRLGINYRR